MLKMFSNVWNLINFYCCFQFLGGKKPLKSYMTKT